MTDTRPDAIDQKNAFQAGFRHGRDCGIVTNREAEEIMLSLRLPVSTATILCFQMEQTTAPSATRSATYSA